MVMNSIRRITVSANATDERVEKRLEDRPQRRLCETELSSKSFHHGCHSFIEQTHNPVRDIGWDSAVVGLRDSASDASERVGITTERDGIANCVFVARRFEERDQCLWHRA